MTVPGVPSASPGGLAQLFSEMAHDLRGPLNVLCITADLLGAAVQRGQGGEVDLERLRRHARVVRDQSRLLAGRLDFILDSLLESMKNSAGICDLGQIAEDAVDGIRIAATHRGVAIECRRPGSRVLIDGHASLIRRILVEILTNGLEATPAGGRVALTLAAGHGMAVVEVEDSGRGIAPDDLGRIFDSDFTTNDPGRGFGLCFATKVVVAHGGLIEVESTAGHGSRLRVNLPLAREFA